MDWRQQLARNLTSETEAYGFTLCIWGAGAILIHRYSAPGVLVVYAYVGGALLGFVVLALAAFRCLFGEREVGKRRELVVASMLHVISTFVNLALSHFLIIATAGLALPRIAVFGVVGFQVTFGYNVLLLIERYLARYTEHFDAVSTE